MQNLLSKGNELNTDLNEILAMQTDDMAWEKISDTPVSRKRLDCIDDEKTGRETSLLKIDPGGALPTEKLSQRMEILVRKGTYSDGHGDYPTGTYILNPPGFKHTPSSKEGCELYVQKRRGFGADHERIVVDTTKNEWSPRFTGKMLRLYEDDAVREEMHIGFMPAGQIGADHDHPGGEEVLILDGEMKDQYNVYKKGMWLRFPGSFRHETISKNGCLLYVREGDIG